MNTVLRNFISVVRMSLMAAAQYVTPSFSIPSHNGGRERRFYFPSPQFDIAASMARKIFRDSFAVRQMLEMENRALIVRGVYIDFPGNLSLENVIYIPMYGNENLHSRDNRHCVFHIRTDEAAAPDNCAEVYKSFRRSFVPSSSGGNFDREKNRMALRFTTLPDVRYASDVMFDSNTKGSRSMNYLLTCIASPQSASRV